MIVAVALDAVVALALVVVAAAWLGRRAWKTLVTRTSGGCACPNASACGTEAPSTAPGGGGPAATDLRAAAARAVERLERRARERDGVDPRPGA